MNILMVGNGFDLAHGLPTRYEDFLEFLRILHGLIIAPNKKVAHQIRVNKVDLPKELRQYLGDAGGDQAAESVAELFDLIAGNAWVEYFLSIQIPNSGWVGFEGEIAQVIQNLDYMRTEDAPGLGRLKHMPGILQSLLALDSLAKSTLIDNIDVIIDKLLQDLDRFIRCLEIYLCLCMEVCHTDKRLRDVLDIGKIDKVLSFNYTDTFRRLYATSYGMAPEYCYIHGQAKDADDISLCNMVLGIDEYLEENERSDKLKFLGFKKYYQRIFKQTDYNYTDWIECIGINLYIIGHSLDKTDGDVLRDILLHDGIHTTIFYHSKEANGAQIANLVRVLGYDNLNTLTRGRDRERDRSITFRQLLPAK